MSESASSNAQSRLLTLSFSGHHPHASLAYVRNSNNNVCEVRRLMIHLRDIILEYNLLLQYGTC